MRRDHVIKVVMVVLAVPALLIPLACLLYIVWRGLPGLSLGFIFSSGEGAGFGESQGVFGQLLGSLALAVGACVVALPLALGVAVYERLLASAAQRRVLDAVLAMLQGIPPIVFGLFGLMLFVHALDWGVSLASGALILSLVVLPTLTLSAVAALQRIAPEYNEAARSLGLSEGRLLRQVWLPQAWPGLVTGMLLGMARALSETAPILFTATVFSGVVWPESIFSPVTTLQTHIFYLAQEGGSEAATQVAWSSALVLILLVAVFAVLARSLQNWRQVDGG